MKPCIKCGTPTDDTRCPDCRPPDRPSDRAPKTSARARGYDTAWRKLSERARRLQPFCSDCGATERLTADHLPAAWQRKAEGKPIRLQDVEVVCGPCNTRRGSSRNQGDNPRPGGSRLAGGSLGARYTPPGVSA